MSGRTFAIGDVHGCAGELDGLLRGLPTAPGDTVVFVGDYVDRGPESARVIDLVLAFARTPGVETVCLLGNHEDMWRAYLGRDGLWGESWLANGGDTTLLSYGLTPDTPPAVVAKRLPPAHLEFLDRLVTSYETPTHVIVHAGIDPRRSLAEQRVEDLVWIREPFLSAPHALGRTVVFGHTPSRTLRVDLPYKIGIDTGCVYGGHLTALCVEDRRVWQVRRGTTRVVESRIEGAGSA